MIAQRAVTALLACVTVAATALAGWLLVTGPARNRAVADVPIAAAPDAPVPPRIPVDSLATAAALRDPFRLARASAPLPFDPAASGDIPAAPPAPRPPLRLVGIALGAEPAALIEGLPGIEGTRVLRVGESVAGYTVRRIEEQHVRIAGPDTTWTLTVRGTEP